MEQKQARLFQLCNRTMALAIGRGIANLRLHSIHSNFFTVCVGFLYLHYIFFAEWKNQV